MVSTLRYYHQITQKFIVQININYITTEIFYTINYDSIKDAINSKWAAWYNCERNNAVCNPPIERNRWDKVYH